MAYRDPETAARAELAKAQELIEELESRVTPELVAELPSSVAATLQSIRQHADDTPRSLDDIRTLLDVFRDYQALLEDIIARAPKLERSFNHLPRSFPSRAQPTHRFVYSDIHDTRTKALRKWLHERIKRYDPDPTLRDTRAKYFDQQMTPYLVEASFKAGPAPLRLLTMAGPFPRQGRTHLLGFYSLFMRTRRSTPALRSSKQGLAAQLAIWLRLQRDTVIGDDRVDDALVIDADQDAAERLLTPKVREALLHFCECCEDPSLVIEDAVARVEWTEWGRVALAFEPAVALLQALRRVPPVSLLQRREA